MLVNNEWSLKRVRMFAALFAVLTVAAGIVFPVGPGESAAFAKSGRESSSDQTTFATTNLLTPRLVVTVRVDGSKRSGILYWEGASPSVSTNVFRNGVRIATVKGSTTGNNLYTDSTRGLRGTVTYKVCYAGTSTCSNSITVNYGVTETTRYAPVCPTTGTAKCIVTRG